MEAPAPQSWMARSKRLSPRRIHPRWVRWLWRFCAAVATSTIAHVEVAAFNIHKALHLQMYRKDYQHGPLYRASLRGFVLTRDGGACVYCKTKSKDMFAERRQGSPP